jgi:hypothetical protein
MKKFIVTMIVGDQLRPEFAVADFWSVEDGSLVFFKAGEYGGQRLRAYAPGSWAHVMDAEVFPDD